MLSTRELSEHQLRQRLTRREIDQADIDHAIARLKADGTLSDRRVAGAIARMETGIRHRGRGRVIQKLRQAGIDGDTAEAAISETFRDVDEGDLLDRAIDRKLRGKAVKDLDEKGRARILRAMIGQGFSFDAVLKRLKP